MKNYLSIDIPSWIFASQNGLSQSNNFSNKLLLLISRFETDSFNNMFLKSLSQVEDFSIENSIPPAELTLQLQNWNSAGQAVQMSFSSYFYKPQIIATKISFFGLHSNAFLSWSCNVKNNVVRRFWNSRFQKARQNLKKKNCEKTDLARESANLSAVIVVTIEQMFERCAFRLAL